MSNTQKQQWCSIYNYKVKSIQNRFKLLMRSTLTFFCQKGILLFVGVSLGVTLNHSHAASSEMPFTPAALFQEAQRVSLDTEPMKMDLFKDSLIILSSTDTSRGQVSVFDVRTMRVKAKRNLPVIPLDMVVDQHGKIFVLGANGSGHSQLLSMDSSLQPLDTFDTRSELIFPLLSLPGVDTLIVGSMKKPIIIINTEDPENLRLSATFIPPKFSAGVGLTWTSTNYATLFVNNSSDVSLVAYDIASTKKLGSIGYTIKGVEAEPYQTVGITGDYPCHSTTGVSFLIWDSRRESLTLAEYDPIFRSLDIQTAAQTNLNADGPDIFDLIAGMDMLRPSGLLATSCDQSAIFLGSTRSRRVIQYAVNKEYRSIEVTGVIDTTFEPSSVVMDPQGRFAFLASEEKQRLVRYEPPLVTEDAYVLGDPKIRKLQRLLTDNGYPVGSVDGVMGPVTKKALELYELNTGSQLDLESLGEELQKSREILR